MTLVGTYTRVMGATVLLAVAAYAAAAESPELAILALPAVAAAWALSSRRPGRVVAPRWLVNLLLLGAIAFAVLRALGGVEVGTIAQLVVALLIIKIFDRTSPRDDAQVLSLTVFLTIAAMLDSNRLLVGLLLIVLIPMIMASVMLYQHHPAWWPQLIAADQPKPTEGLARWRRTLIRTTALATAAVTIIAGVVFILMPRGLGENAFGPWARPAGASVTGFAERISLGRRGVISESPEIVLDLIVREDRGEPGAAALDIIGSEETIHYLRGAVLDIYREGSWSQATRRSPTTQDYVGPSAGPLPITRHSESGPLLVQTLTYHTRPGRDRELPVFHLWRPVRVMVDRRSTLRFDSQAATIGLATTLGPPTVTVWSTNTEPTNSSWGPPRGTPSFPLPRVVEFAQGLLRQAGVEPDPDVRPREEDAMACRILQEHLRTNFTYSLEEPAVPPGVDPIEHFLFTTRTGHCEYFASAMAAMCRAVGIHARVVTGYVATEFNATTGHYTVRQSNAHAWVEAGRQSWRRYDPTPPADLVRIHRAEPTIASAIRRFIGTIEYAWNSSFVSFDEIRRQRLMGPGGVATQQAAWIERMTDRMRRARSGGATQALAAGLATFTLVAVIALAAAYLLPKVFAKLRRRQTLGPDRRAAAPRTAPLYADLLARLARAGHAKPPWLTPKVHAEQAPVPWASLARDIVDAYYRERFAARPPMDDELKALRQRLDEITRSVPARS